MNEELIDKIYHALVDPEPEDLELRKTLRNAIKKMIEDDSLEEMIKEARRFRDHGEAHWLNAVQPNKLKDFDPAKFTIIGYCANCDHSAPVRRTDEDMEIPTLIARLSCSRCGSGDCSIRIVYTAAGGFAYGY